MFIQSVSLKQYQYQVSHGTKQFFLRAHTRVTLERPRRSKFQCSQNFFRQDFRPGLHPAHDRQRQQVHQRGRRRIHRRRGLQEQQVLERHRRTDHRRSRPMSSICYFEKELQSGIFRVAQLWDWACCSLKEHMYFLQWHEAIISLERLQHSSDKDVLTLHTQTSKLSYSIIMERLKT